MEELSASLRIVSIFLARIPNSLFLIFFKTSRDSSSSEASIAEIIFVIGLNERELRKYVNKFRLERPKC